MRGWTMLFLAIATIAVSGFFGTSTSACACVGPMPESELRALIQKANKGDIRATGQVWQEYALARENAREGKRWASRAIRVGDPGTMNYMADRWMREGQETSDKRYKLIFYEAAVSLLENGYRNRAMLSHCDVNDRYSYVSNLRSARAALRTARTGPAFEIARAARGSSSAAYNVANHYFWVDLDQQRRARWERRASELGDPMYAGNIVDRQASREDIRDIKRALKQKADIARLGDRWVRDAVTVELRDRLLRTSHFASGRRGRPKGLSCADS